ncbi:MAG: small subunit ribosomal protein [Candidatus Binataceae bacterium]|jgi:small subunit ribosomal protein S1|nr:small subunit ribosomal protein [Candidatus Binataceae bacterium]MEA2680109.1 small subunit ribosomal protein [Candidatus Binataceae bacterium]
MEKDLSEKANGGTNDFESMMEQSLRAPRTGDVLIGTVLLITRDNVIIDINYKCEGQVPLAEFLDHDGNVTVKEGDEVDVFFEGTETENGTVMLSHAKAEKFKVWRELEQAFQNEAPVEGVILGKVKGGLQVDIGVPAFLPGSHVDLRPARNLDRYVGQRGRFQILKFNRARGNVVVSRRSVIERERTSLKEETLKVLEEGVILEGTVKNITDYGAFVDLGGIDGLLHITDMAWGRLQHPSEVLKVGEKVKVVVLKYDQGRERVSLGMKQIMPDPWTKATESYPVGARLRGKVVSVTDYGAFVELEKGVEGLIHVSEMSWSKRAVHPSKVVNVGDMVEVQVLGVDEGNRRISLGLKQTEPNPWEALADIHPIGSTIKGKVKSITDFGVFVEIEPGIDGLVHISDLSWTKKVRHPSEVYKKGDEVEAVVLGIEVEHERVSLGVKQLTADPWDSVAQRYPLNSRVNGKVSSVADFGVFVELEEGIEGLIHISQLSNERVDKPSSLFKVGDELEALVVQVDSKERRIGLSVKGLRAHEEREEMQAYLKREHEASRFSLEDILKEELRLDRDDRSPRTGRGR